MTPQQEQRLEEIRASTRRHVQALRDVLVAEHEETVAQAEAAAQDAEQSDSQVADILRDHATRLRAMPYPWETGEHARLVR